jgi:glycosyltransferase involved in cell wall biosynthesis
MNARGEPPPDLAAEAAVRILPSTIPIASIGQHTSLPLLFKRLAADVVLTTHPLAAAFYMPCPAVAAILDLYPLHFPDQFARPVAPYYRTVFRSIAQRRRIIAISEATKRDAVRLLQVRPETVTVTHLAADEHFRPVLPGPVRSEVLARYGVTSPYVLYHGNKRPHKNVVGLVRAFAQVHERMPDLRLVITGREVAGDRECDHTDIRSEAEHLGITSSIVFAGYVEDADLPSLYSAAEVTAVPSLIEGFGLPALESMACGTPVVASRAGALPEVVGDAGLLVDPGQTEALAEAIIRVVGDPEQRRRLSEVAVRRAAEFSWSKAARITLEVLQEAARRS